MAIKKFNPITPTQRYKTVIVSPELKKKSDPLKSLSSGKKQQSGRGAKGRISVRRRGGGHKKKLRTIDFKRDKIGIPGKVAFIEYDPNRTGHIALINYADGEKRYILCPSDLKVGDTIINGNDAPINPGCSLPLKYIPVGTDVYNIELKPKYGGQLARSAGNFATVMARDGDYCLVKLPSGEVRKFHNSCAASIGRVSNIDHDQEKIGKAGRTRWLGRRPKVRGAVMNPVDHPHGGGEGKAKCGRHPVSPTGKPTKGATTRKPNKPSDKQIVSKRKKRG